MIGRGIVEWTAIAAGSLIFLIPVVGDKDAARRIIEAAPEGRFEELGNNEVAQILDIRVTAASMRYVRALKRLRQLLAPSDGTPSTWTPSSRSHLLPPSNDSSGDHQAIPSD